MEVSDKKWRLSFVLELGSSIVLMEMDGKLFTLHHPEIYPSSQLINGGAVGNFCRVI